MDLFAVVAIHPWFFLCSLGADGMQFTRRKALVFSTAEGREHKLREDDLLKMLKVRSPGSLTRALLLAPLLISLRVACSPRRLNGSPTQLTRVLLLLSLLRDCVNAISG